MAETFLIRLTGGPHPGDRLVVEGEPDIWPLPETFPDEDGFYLKTGQSQLPAGGPHIIRGAFYEWVPSD